MAKGTDDTIAVRISKALADRIISGAIEPGARLRQDHVAEEFIRGVGLGEVVSEQGDGAEPVRV